MMRLKKGDRVEVMNNKEDTVSWHVAEIMSGNGPTYRVRYDSYPGMETERVVETISRKFVRPCPPPVRSVENCITGDIVEVFYEYAWKIAAVLRVLEGRKEIRSKKVHLQAAAVKKRYLVRLLGCSQELVVDKSNIRMRQTWLDDNWILIAKSPRGGEDVIATNPSTFVSHQKMGFQNKQFNTRAQKQPQNNYVNIHDEAALRESHMLSSRSLKRISPYSSSIIEAHNGHAQKLRAIDKDGKKQRTVAAPVLVKVDDVSYRREILGEKNMHASVKIISTGYNEMERTKLNDVLGCSGVRNSALNSSDSDSCSVGSCSVTDQNPDNFSIPFRPKPWQERHTVCSDAESHYSLGSERKSSSLPPKEEVEVSIRKLELRAYRRTLEALYASGLLSWEQEALLTNLRIMLHISNDEHLMELKNLISSKTATNIT